MSSITRIFERFRFDPRLFDMNCDSIRNRVALQAIASHTEVWDAKVVIYWLSQRRHSKMFSFLAEHHDGWESFANMCDHCYTMMSILTLALATEISTRNVRDPISRDAALDVVDAFLFHAQAQGPVLCPTHASNFERAIGIRSILLKSYDQYPVVHSV